MTRNLISSIGLSLVIALGFLSSAFGASDTSCQTNLITYSRNTFSNRLREVPGLANWIFQIMEDPMIPRSVKILLKQVLEPEDSRQTLTIRNLTEELRHRWMLETSTGAFFLTRNVSYRLFKGVAWSPLANSSLFGPGALVDRDLEFPSTFSVAISDRPISEKENDFFSLIHELAHIRFDMLFRRYLPRIIRRLPRGLGYQASDGTCYINDGFFDFIHERYAITTEYLIFAATHKRPNYPWGSFTNEKFGEALLNLDEETLRQAISDYVIRVYTITDPQVTILAQTPLSQILRGNIPTAFEIEPIRVILGDLYYENNEHRFKFAYFLVSAALSKARVIKTGRSYRLDALDAQTAIRRDPRAEETLTTLIPLLLERLRSQPAAMNALIDILKSI